MTVSSKSDVPLLADELGKLAEQLHAHGETLWERSHEWVRLETRSGDGERGGGLGDAIPEDVVDERLQDRQASRYRDEILALLRRLDADARRLNRVVGIVCPDQPRQLKNKEMLAAQVGAEGWCVSCHRDQGHLEPVHVGYYRDACRACGDWRGAHGGELPPMAVVKWRHRHPGKRVPLAIVEAALAGR